MLHRCSSVPKAALRRAALMSPNFSGPGALRSPPRGNAHPRSMSSLFAKPVITLEDLERRLIMLLEGNDSVRPDTLGLCWATRCNAALTVPLPCAAAGAGDRAGEHRPLDQRSTY